MGWNYEEVGEFGSTKAAEDWAKRNDIDPRDLHIRSRGDGVSVGVKRSALGDEKFNDNHNGRRDGFFR